ncbi:YfcC family protein [Salicibibacter cibarius]|uniref:YfcC family protein n=1 Tax=Salicibibacter cibarius TaxID=2743000 RepID=A0A7T6Z2H2_9BACI|nr:TIGR00366 family protein [Salicibibacter cibarius]QQK75778.1 YfcC family protein [Salicibibacter cibarius]
MIKPNQKQKNQLEPEKRKRKFIMPHTYAILFFIMLLCAGATYILTPGEYDREIDEATGNTLVVNDSYSSVEASPISFFDIFQAIPLGMQDAADIVFFIFLIGGAFGIIRATGALEAGVAKAVIKLEGKEKLMIPISMIIFSIAGFTIGSAEEMIIFVPIGVALARATGFDAITGTAMITLGAASGFIGGMLNPFTVGIAQEIAELQLFSGFAFRFVVYLVLLTFAIWYVSRYASRVKNDPSKSVIYEIELKEAHNSKSKEEMTAFSTLSFRHHLIFVVIIGGLGFNVYGVFQWGWFITELTASFLIMGILAGLLGKLSINRIFDSFIDGAKALAFGSLIVGFARAILVILEEGKIIDTITFSLVEVIQNFSDGGTAIGMFFSQSFLNFFIPAGPAQAMTTMPIMVPVSDLLGVSRQVAVLAFQYGDGITNSIIPTSAALMGYLAIAGIPYEKWVKFVWKLILGWTVIATVALLIAVSIGIE